MPMTTLDAGITHVPLFRKRSIVALAAAALAVAGFVAVSLALKFSVHLALASLGLVEDSYGQCAEFILISGVSMFVARKALDTATIRYNGKLIFFVFLTISMMTMVFALSSGIMKVNFLISLLQMAALCAFSYLQFWTHDRAISERP